MQPVTKTAMILFIVYLLVAADLTNAKSIEKRDTKVDYFDNFIEQLDELRKTPILGDLIGPWIIQIQSMLEQSNRLSDKSLGKVVNSMMPCNFSYKFVTCQGTLDIDNAKLLVKKILSFLVPNVVPQQYTPMIQFAAKML